MAKFRIYPRPGSVYTLNMILKDLTLDDTPHLNFWYNNLRSVIQTSHTTDEELLSIPEFGLTEWKYIRTTSEWIPIFEYASDDEASILKFIDIEPYVDKYEVEPNPTYWATPKGFPRDQHTGV
jgi:hypothetical protein